MNVCLKAGKILDAEEEPSNCNKVVSGVADMVDSVDGRK